MLHIFHTAEGAIGNTFHIYTPLTNWSDQVRTLIIPNSATQPYHDIWSIFQSCVAEKALGMFLNNMATD